MLRLVENRKHYECNCCGKVEPWGPGWRSRTIFHRFNEPGAWEDELLACSTECAQALDQKHSREKLPAKSEISDGQLQGLAQTKQN